MLTDLGRIGNFFFPYLLQSSAGEDKTGQYKFILFRRMKITDAEARFPFGMVICYGQDPVYSGLPGYNALLESWGPIHKVKSGVITTRVFPNGCVSCDVIVLGTTIRVIRTC